MKTTTQKTASGPGLGAGDGVLVDRQWLDAHLSDPAVRVVEVDVSPAAYNEWHIDGAVLWNIYQDLKDPGYRPAGTAALEHLVARSGIGSESTVVFYGYAPALGLWLMQLQGIRMCVFSTARVTPGGPKAVRGAPPPGCRRPAASAGASTILVSGRTG